MKVLGKQGVLWTAFVAGVEKQAPSARQNWNFSGAKYGWSMRLMKGDRVLVYLTPQDGAFMVGVALGERAVRAGANARLSAKARKAIADAPRYAEGRGIRFAIATRTDVTAALQLVELKVGS